MIPTINLDHRQSSLTDQCLYQGSGKEKKNALLVQDIVPRYLCYNVSEN